VISRNWILALAGLALTLGIIWGISVLTNLSDCMNASDDASCPALADVNGVRYFISIARGVEIDAADLTAYAPITQTNVPGHFRELTTFTLAGVSPDAALAAPATNVIAGEDSAYRLLSGPERASAFPALCEYFNAAEQALIVECAPASPTPQ
jgi:hypothetical protein